MSSQKSKVGSNPHLATYVHLIGSQMSQISSIISNTFIDIVDMCSFDSKGRSLFSIRENQKPEEEVVPPLENNLGQNPISFHLVKNAEKIGKKLGISKQDIQKDSMRIWNIMNPEQKEYFVRIYEKEDEPVSDEDEEESSEMIPESNQVSSINDVKELFLF